jgi:hypothetical protein
MPKKPPENPAAFWGKMRKSSVNWGWKNQSPKAGTCQDSKAAGVLLLY